MSTLKSSLHCQFHRSQLPGETRWESAKWDVNSADCYLSVDCAFMHVVAVIEHVRDGCTVRAFLLPSFQYITVMLSGIKVLQNLSTSWHHLCQ